MIIRRRFARNRWSRNGVSRLEPSNDFIPFDPRPPRPHAFPARFRRLALIVASLIGIVVSAAAVIIALIPACTDEMAPVGGRGGIVCVSTLGRGSWVLIPVALISLCVVVIAIRELVVTSHRTDRAILAAQIPLIG